MYNWCSAITNSSLSDPFSGEFNNLDFAIIKSSRMPSSDFKIITNIYNINWFDFKIEKGLIILFHYNWNSFLENCITWPKDEWKALY